MPHRFKSLLDWMHERQRIFLKKKAGLFPPWTNDLIFQKYRFCNCYREQDTVTQWIRENWREPYKDHKNLWFAMCVARQINWPPALAAIGFPVKWESDKVRSILQNRAARGEKNYSSAYMLTAAGFPKGSIDKPSITVDHVLQTVWDKAQKKPLTFGRVEGCLEEAFDWFFEKEPKLYGWGAFTAYEVVTDLRHTRYLCNAFDINKWANAGPGAVRGLNRLFKRELNQKLHQLRALDEMREVLAWLKCERDPNILPQLEMRDVEHSLCEFDKYLRVKEQLANGKPVTIDRYNSKQGTLF